MPRKNGTNVNQNNPNENVDDEVVVNEEKKDNEQPVNLTDEELEKKKKQDDNELLLDGGNLVLESKPDNNLISNEVEVNQEKPIDKKLAEVSKNSGLNLKAYFVEENSNEINEISKGNLGYVNFKFNGNMKDFYSKLYRHVIESNLIARQLADESERSKYPTIKELSQKFEEFMKEIGDELVKRGHLEKYEPFGGLNANELKEIENSCLLNRPRSEREAIERNVTNIEGKNFDEIVEKGYERATTTISTLFGETYKKGDDPAKDEVFLQTSANLIKGMSVLRGKEKIWNPYFPDLSAPKWNKPIHKHLISNGFKAIGRGLSIAFDGLVKFPLNNALRGIAYPFNKAASLISIAYNQRQLENLVYAKGFTKEDLKSVMNTSEKPALDVENDVKEIEENFKTNQKKIEEYKQEQHKEPVSQTENKEPTLEENKVENEHKKPMVIDELNDNNLLIDTTPFIEDNSLNKTKTTQINNV